MKASNIRITLLAALLFAAGCSKERIDFDPTPGPDGEVGYLVLSEMNVNVNTDTENVGQSAKNASQTRAAVDASDDYVVTITNSVTQETVLTESYGAIKQRTAPIALAPGQYRVAAKSPNADNIPAAAFDSPAYRGSATVQVIKNKTQQVPTIVCKLANIKTSIFFSDLLKGSFDLNDAANPLQVTVALGDNMLTFPHTETRAGYFRAVNDVNKLVATLSGSYNTAPKDETPVYKPVKQSVEIDNVRAGQWRQIRFAIQVSTEGNVIFSVQVDTWVDDEPIDVDVMEAGVYTFTEEVIPDDQAVSDPDSPVLTLDNHHNVEDPFVISGDLFDDEGACSDRIRMIFTPQGGTTVTRVLATISSENEQFMQALAAAGFENGELDITEPFSIDGTNYTTVDNIGTGTKKINVTSVAMRTLYEFAGTHTVRLAATDSQNRTSYTDLKIVVRRNGSSDESGPSIVWLNRNIDTRYVANQLTGDDCCVIEINSNTGITEFLVDIDGGTVLTDADLQSLGLAPHMDLIAPATEQMDSMLNSLGFKTKDAVNGAKHLNFNISKFMPMLVALGNAGPVDFKLTVTDAEGKVSKSVMLTVRQDQ